MTSLESTETITEVERVSETDKTSVNANLTQMENSQITSVMTSLESTETPSEVEGVSETKKTSVSANLTQQENSDSTADRDLAQIKTGYKSGDVDHSETEDVETSSSVFDPVTKTTDIITDKDQHGTVSGDIPASHSVDHSETKQMVINSENVEPGNIAVVDQIAVEKLTYGVMAAFLPTLQTSQRTLTEVIENQRILMETLEQENTKFRESDDFVAVQQMMLKAKLYHNKLLSIKKDMIGLHEKSAKLKKRALKLQQQKQKLLLQEEQAREQELDREQQLVAKLSSVNK